MARPTTVRSACRILDLSERQVQRLVAQGDLGKTRQPTAKERKAYDLAPNTQILDGDKVQQLRRARVKAEIRRETGR